MKVLKGTSASSGISTGTVCLYKEGYESSIDHYGISPEAVGTETMRLREAREKALASMRSMIASSEKTFDAKSSDIFKSHLMMLEDRTILEKTIELIKKRRINAEHALNDVFEDYLKKFESVTGHFAELKHDIIDIRDRFLYSFKLIPGHFNCAQGEKKPVVVATNRLTPSMILNIPKERVKAFVASEGGFTSHATILARSYNVPVLFGIDVEKHLKCGSHVIVDGSASKVIISPDKKTLDAYKKKILKYASRKTVCVVKKGEPSKTGRGHRITLKANISIPGELDMLKHLNFDGIGLLRTEFLFSDRKKAPSEDDQYSMYRLISGKASGLPVNIRLLDIGEDKLPEYLNLPDQNNPDLGIRGARAAIFFKDIYLTQLKAILRASVWGNLRILYPMISDMTDLYTFKHLLAEAAQALRSEGARFNEKLKEGIMIETPSAAILSDQLLKKVDFANIGSNDLLQYTLASARNNTYIENRYHIMHPSLVYLIEIAAKAGKRQKKEVCLCGEIASFDEFYSVLLETGLSSFSVSAQKLFDIKCEILHYTKSGKNLLDKFYRTETREETERLLMND